MVKFTYAFFVLVTTLSTQSCFASESSLLLKLCEQFETKLSQFAPVGGFAGTTVLADTAKFKRVVAEFHAIQEGFFILPTPASFPKQEQEREKRRQEMLRRNLERYSKALRGKFVAEVLRE